jgi:hypothetical protein
MLQCSGQLFGNSFEADFGRFPAIDQGGISMLIGVPKEIKNHEYRVGMTPTSVKEAVRHGHEVWVQANAGSGIGAADADYTAAGAGSFPRRRRSSPRRT